MVPTTRRAASRVEPSVLPERVVLAGLVAIAVALAVFRIDQVAHIDTTVATDEIGYIGNARHLVGGYPDVIMTGTFYSGGSSLLLVPIAALTRSPTTLHVAGVVVNIVLVSGLLLLLYRLLRHRLGAGRLPAFTGAVLAGTIPWLTSNAATLWSETSLAVLFVVWLLGVGTLRPGHRWWGPVGFAATSVALHAVHSRMIGIMALGLVLLVAAAVAGRIRSSTLVASLVTFAVALALTRWMNASLADAVYLSDAGDTGNTLLRRLRWGDVGSYLDSASGQLWGVLVSTFGLVVPGVWWLARGTWTGRRALLRWHPRREGDVDARGGLDPLVTAAALVALAWMAALSTVQIGTGIGRLSRGVVDTVRSDLLVYTRYVEPVALVAVAAGGAWLSSLGVRLKERLGVTAATLAALAVTTLWIRAAFPFDWFAAFYSPPNASVVYGWIHRVGSFSPLRIAVPVAILVVALMALPGVARRVAAVGAVVVALSLTHTIAVRHLEHFSDHAHRTNDVPMAINQLDAVDEVGFVAPWTGSAFYTYQFWLEDAEYRLVREDSIPDDLNLVIAPLTWERAPELGAVRIADDPELDTALWSLPG